MDHATFDPGEVIIAEGEIGDRLYVLIDGSAHATRKISSGALRHLGHVGAGQVVGEMALMGMGKRTATVIADEPINALVLASDAFQELLTEHQNFASVITTIIGERLGHQREDALSTTTLEGYKIRRRLGRGAMSVVYDADAERDGRRVALKMMSHRLCFDGAARRAFQQEADSLLSFDHPHIARLVGKFDAFATSFLAIEYLDGETLAELLQCDGPFAEADLLSILGALASALSYAHAHGIVHRDVKPGNCMVTTSGRVVLMDFGLSVPFFDPDENLTVAGTPAYMAPEQLRGEVCPESDWFSLGCVAYELMTGKRLLNARSPRSLSKVFQDWDIVEILDHLPRHFPRTVPLVEPLLSLDPERRTRRIPDLVKHCGPVSLQ